MRDTLAAAKGLVAADDAWLRELAHRDPDMIRDVAAALVHARSPEPGPSCGATDCVNACDGGHGYENCPNVWREIVHCPTDNSEHMMKLSDGTSFRGRWSTYQQRWQRRAGPQRYQDVVGDTVERIVWSNLPEGTYPTHFRTL